MAETLSDRVAEIERLLIEAVKEAGMSMTGDRRVGEPDAAALLCFSVGGLRNKRKEGSAPKARQLSVGTCRISYRIRDIAEWIAKHSEEI